jgi:hypothetical protein
VMMDGSIVRAHPCAAGASKKRWAGRLYVVEIFGTEPH